MKQKLFTLLTLALFFCSGAWADADPVQLFTADFTNAKYNVTYPTSQYGSVTIDEGGTNVKIQGFKTNAFAWSSTNGITFTSNNLSASAGKITSSNPNYFIAIPLTDVNGSITVTTTGDDTQWYYSYSYDDNGTEKVIARAQFSTNNTATITIPDEETTLYIGNKDKKIKSITITTPAPAIPGDVTFSPATGSSVNAGSSITLSAENATSYKYKWTSSTTTPIDGWSTGATATVPEYGSENVYLHAYGVSSAGDGAASYAQYTITQPKVATPTFSPKSKGFTAASLSVTITCATADAAIQYSYDNSTWNDYSSAISVTATTTIYAKATKSGYIDSDVSSEKYTKQDAGSSGSVSDLVAVSSGYTFISETIVPGAGNIYHEGKIYTTKTNTVKSDKGSSIINGESYSNCLRLRNGEDVVFKTDGACLLTLYCSTVNNNAVAAGSTVGGDEYGSYTTATTGGTRVFVIPAAGTVYVTGTSNNSDWCIAGFTLTDIPTATITTNKGKWASFTPSWNATLSTGATAYIITDVTGENITATSVSVLGANKGYFVKGTAALTPYTATPIGSDADATTGNKIVACTSATDLNATTPNDHDKYVLGTTSTGESGLFLVDSDVTVGAGKAYLDADGTGGAHVLSLNFDESGDVTGISNVNNEVKSLFDGDFYNLNGQRVAQPGKGLYIMNGKKVIIK